MIGRAAKAMLCVWTAVTLILPVCSCQYRRIFGIEELKHDPLPGASFTDTFVWSAHCTCDENENRSAEVMTSFPKAPEVILVEAFFATLHSGYQQGYGLVSESIACRGSPTGLAVKQCLEATSSPRRQASLGVFVI